MPDKPCKGCPDYEGLKESVKSGRLDVTKLQLPQVFLMPPANGNPLQALQFSMPHFDGIQRKYQRPVFHEDGSIEYPRLSSDTDEPPPIKGYVRDQDNLWRFIPIWPECRLRGQGVKMAADGSINTAMSCNHPDAEQFGKAVDCETCIECPLRKRKGPAQ